ncbi:hypothetical protein ABC977_07190 [Thioalkalicoccus limnaeus]|uniref:MarR family transcriptional regulator n=1 Tax=Thioalkalicoccus limnaeus TaxID=120681 RepID=A0ABV4BCG5_9GAMM
MTKAHDESSTPVWEVVPIGDFALPSDTQLNLAKKRWHSLRSLFQLPQGSVETHAKAEEDLRALPTVRLEQLVPPIDWSEPATALDRFLAPRQETAGRETGLYVLIGQPHIDHGAMLREWAGPRAAAVHEAPDPAVILSEKRDASRHWKASDGPWVIPELERWFLRHAHGLWLVRDLLEQAARGQWGAGIIGCDSWAWAYLQRVWPIPNPTVLALQAFDGRSLARYLTASRLAGPRPSVRFCNARTGEPLTSGADDGETSRELRQLAAHCRGNPAIAREYWRRRLRTEPETAHARVSDAPDPSPDPSADEDVVWLASGIETPVLPVETSEDLIFILHTLLLHNGLPATTLADLLPPPRTQLMSNLLRLQAMGLVESQDDVWRVSALGYPGVREFLRSHGYLVDAF